MRRNTCRVRLDEGVDGSDDALRVVAVAVRVGSGSDEVGGRKGVIDPAVAYRLEFVALSADSIMSRQVLFIQNEHPGGPGGDDAEEDHHGE